MKSLFNSTPMTAQHRSPHILLDKTVQQLRSLTRRVWRFGLVFGLVTAVAGCAAWHPPPENAADAPVDPLSAMVALYRGPLNHLNAVRAGTCPMHPSCSTYALSATHKHGPVIGWTMAFDRLIRCGRDELKYAPEIPVNGNWRYHDPVSGNDFWWHEPK